MKQFVIATLSLAGLLAPSVGMSQQCVIVCNPPRVYCVPAGTPLPPIYDMCKRTYALSSESEPSLLAPAASSAPAPACTAQQVFDEETQSYDWQMVCD